jgi:hypothetical protein
MVSRCLERQAAVMPVPFVYEFTCGYVDLKYGSRGALDDGVSLIPNAGEPYFMKLKETRVQPFDVVL